MAETEIRVTFETLFELLRHEKKRGELQKLPEGFLEDVAKYLGHKKAVAVGDENAANQLKQIYRIIEELFAVRERKIIELARLKATSLRPEHSAEILPHEDDLYKKLIILLKGFRDQLSFRRSEVRSQKSEVRSPQSAVVNPNPQQSEVRSPKSEVTSEEIKFTSPVPKFMGKDKVYGPFEAEQVVRLPKQLAHVMVSGGKATYVQ